MKLNQEAINDFKAVYSEEYGVNISDKEAQEYGSSLLSLMKVIST